MTGIKILGRIVLGPDLKSTGETKHFKNGVELGVPHELRIVQYSNSDKERILTGLSLRVSSKGLLINWGQNSRVTGQRETLFRRVKDDCMPNIK